MLDIYAGEFAIRKIKEHGISPTLFDSFLAASGGPKSFVLSGLDEYLFGQFFTNKESPLNLIGSSAGAYRVASIAKNNPVYSLNQLANAYVETDYRLTSSREKVAAEVARIIETVLGHGGSKEILSNQTFIPHFIATMTVGLSASENKLKQSLGLFLSFVFNQFDRNLLSKQFSRYMYHSPYSTLQINPNDNFDTHWLPLEQTNMNSALYASGAMPLKMYGQRDIYGANNGVLRDGGLVDYHPDLGIVSNKLTLFPHFYNRPKAGWFDKFTSRVVPAKNLSNAVLLCPSNSFIASLPFGKLPDKNDFYNMDSKTRNKYWRTVIRESHRLVEEFRKYEKADYCSIKVRSFPFK